MSDNSDRVTTYKRRKKIKMIRALGGVCVCCAYSKNFPPAFHFYDTQTQVSEYDPGTQSWESTVATILRSSVLLCSNCEREVSLGFLSIPEDAPRFNESYADSESASSLLTEWE